MSALLVGYADVPPINKIPPLNATPCSAWASRRTGSTSTTV